MHVPWCYHSWWDRPCCDGDCVLTRSSSEGFTIISWNQYINETIESQLQCKTSNGVSSIWGTPTHSKERVLNIFAQGTIDSRVVGNVVSGVYYGSVIELILKLVCFNLVKLSMLSMHNVRPIWFLQLYCVVECVWCRVSLIMLAQRSASSLYQQLF